MKITTYYTDDKDAMIAREVQNLKKSEMFEEELVSRNEFVQIVKNILPSVSTETAKRVKDRLHLIDTTYEQDNKDYSVDTMAVTFLRNEEDKNLLLKAYSDLLHKKTDIYSTLKELTMDNADRLLVRDGFFDSFYTYDLVRTTELLQVVKDGDYEKHNITLANSLKDVYKLAEIGENDKVTVTREGDKKYLVMNVDKENGEKETSVVIPLKWLKEAVGQYDELQEWISMEQAEWMVD